MDFVEFHAQKVLQGEATTDEAEWTKFSLAQAMIGLENEDSSEYREADLKEKW